MTNVFKDTKLSNTHSNSKHTYTCWFMYAIVRMNLHVQIREFRIVFVRCVDNNIQCSTLSETFKPIFARVRVFHKSHFSVMRIYYHTCFLPSHVVVWNFHTITIRTNAWLYVAYLCSETLTCYIRAKQKEHGRSRKKTTGRERHNMNCEIYWMVKSDDENAIWSACFTTALYCVTRGGNFPHAIVVKQLHNRNNKTKQNITFDVRKTD